jgi:transcriptional regulator with AAA-type ATPase domain
MNTPCERPRPFGIVNFVLLGQGLTETQKSDLFAEQAAAVPVPGVAITFANHRARSRLFRWEGVALELGRAELAEAEGLDAAISRQHVRLTFEGGSWVVEDLGSRNGSFVGGERLSGRRQVAANCPVRVGGALLLPLTDAVGFEHFGVGVQAGLVSGPALRRTLELVAHARKSELLSSVLISGESGTGKEIAARVFHAAGPDPNAPFAAVNCATIPKDLAERLLFGARRGAFSGALDAQGHVQAADGGTLFLDEIAELPLEVQTKLLRMLETREVIRLGATSPERVNVRVCAATWRDLRQEVAAGRFREDLYFRIGQPEIRLPALRERPEEIPWHVQSVVESAGVGPPLAVCAGFVEACSLRAWPGNVRELGAEVRRCVAAARAQGVSKLTAGALGATAGMRILRPDEREHAQPYPRDDVATALAAEDGNVAGAARRLGVHRNRVRRWLERYGVDPRSFKG